MGKLLYDLIVVSAKWLAAVKEQLWLVGQAVKTSPSHGENRGSIPLRAVEIIMSSSIEINKFYSYMARWSSG